MELLLGVLLLSASVLIFRFLGAWMFRINDVINELEKLNKNFKNK